jgi:membrane associated rhomboid family serine protease
MIFPVGHENLQGRRWPVVTIALIVVSAAVFLATFSRMEDEAQELSEAKTRLMLVAIWHPEAERPPSVQQLLDTFYRGYPQYYQQYASKDRRPESDWEVNMRGYSAAQAQAEMAALTEELAQYERTGIIERFAYYTYKKDFYRYITANFLHSGWLGLLFDLWFLWLAGAVLEDTWGRIAYPIFFFSACVISLLIHGLFHADDVRWVMGPGGAIAALMGAFLVRYPKSRIQFLFIWIFVIRPRFYWFKIPAYVLLSGWVAAQLLMAALAGEAGDTSYAVTLGGFVFGCAGALLLKVTGIENDLDRAIEAKVSWSADPRIVRATELLKTQPDEAIRELQAVVRENPRMIEAWNLLVTAYSQKQDIPALSEALAMLCGLHVKEKEMDAAWQNYEQFIQHGGGSLPAEARMELCRWLEEQQNWERAAQEYEKYAHAYPADRLSIYALVGAARLQLGKLSNRVEAARLYREAEASPIPHLDWDEAIRRGLREAAG